MAGEVYRLKWVKRQALFRAFISLCILVIFLPELTQAICSPASATSISPYTRTFAILPAYSPGVDKLHRDRRNLDPPRKTSPTEDHASALWALRNLVPNPGSISHEGKQQHFVLGEWSRAACQLLDLPPPSHTGFA